MHSSFELRFNLILIRRFTHFSTTTISNGTISNFTSGITLAHMMLPYKNVLQCRTTVGFTLMHYFDTSKHVCLSNLYKTTRFDCDDQVHNPSNCVLNFSPDGILATDLGSTCSTLQFLASQMSPLQLTTDLSTVKFETRLSSHPQLSALLYPHTTATTLCAQDSTCAP